MKKWISVVLFVISLMSAAGIKDVHALQLDWSGQFWADQHWLNNYQLSRGTPGYDREQSLIDAGGYYTPGTGEKNIIWYSMFMRLNPKLVVNDSINIKSEWHVGSPIFGFWGRGWPTYDEERVNFTGSQRDNFAIGAQRFWANLITDFGTVELGRAPLDWGLGAIWNDGSELFDRYQSTGDMVRLTSKFGNFSIQPALVKVTSGSNVGGALAFQNGTLSTTQVVQGHDDVTDYDLAVKYDNSEEDFEFGMMWTRRSGNVAQKTIFFNPQLTGSTRINYNLFDFYAHKKWGRWSVGGEIPLFNGDIGAIDGQNEFTYKTYAVVVEGQYSSDVWDIGLKLGHVPGQPPTAVGDKKFNAVFLNKNYDLGLIMFNYNISGLTANNPDTITAPNSPYGSAVVNANYIALKPDVKFDKWTFSLGLVAAWADQVAQGGRQFYNYERRQFFNGVANQARFMGYEIDPGVTFKWDENFVLNWTTGFWFPGEYYAFSNSRAVPKLETDMMFASQVRAGITF